MRNLFSSLALLAIAVSGGCHAPPAARPFCSGWFCPAWDSCMVTKQARHAGLAAYSRYVQQCGNMPGMSFRCGFEQAYVDIAQGGNGVTPAIPPPRYWTAGYRTEYGHAQAQDWFQGYSEGAAMAQAEGFAAYNQIPVSAGMDPGIDPTLAAEGPGMSPQYPGAY